MDKSDFDAIYERACKKGTITKEKARDLAVKRFQNSKGYYNWTPMGKGEDSAWLVRIPRNDLPEEAWLKEEKADFVHFCEPIKYLEAVKKRDKELASKATAYVRDKNNTLNNLEELCCTKCGKKASESIHKKVKMFISLTKLEAAK